MMMLSPDLLDRRALALVELRDPWGRPLISPARLSGEGLRVVAKGGGRFAIVAAAGFAAHESTFAAAPQAPAIGSVGLRLDIAPADSAFAPRSAVLKLPRDPDPDHGGQPGSVFQAVAIALLPAPQSPIPATAAGVRVTVRKKGDGRRVAGALVRVASADGKFKAHAVTDAAGEALVVLAQFPPSHTGGGGQIADSLEATATVVADPAKIALLSDAEVMPARDVARGQFAGFTDPDALDAALPDPGNGKTLRLSTRVVATLELEWTNP